MSNANERFLYEIRPIKPIKDLIPGKGIKAPCSMQLTKEEALHCMKYGSVYRNFSDSGMNPIRVTGSTIDRLHNAKFISEDEWMKKIGKEIVSEQQEEESTVEETPVEEVPVTTEKVVEEITIVEETPVVEEVVAEEETTEDAQDFLPTEEEESTVTSSEEEQKSQDTPAVNHSGNKLAYSKNNKNYNKNHKR